MRAIMPILHPRIAMVSANHWLLFGIVKAPGSSDAPSSSRNAKPTDTFSVADLYEGPESSIPHRLFATTRVAAVPGVFKTPAVALPRKLLPVTTYSSAPDEIASPYFCELDPDRTPTI